MEKPIKTTPVIVISTEPGDFSPTQEQVETLARRLMPEIMKFFSDEQIQREFAEWMERQRNAA